MEYDLKAVVRDITYTYQGYPHEDEEIEITAWDGDRRFPVGDAVKVQHSAGDGFADQRAKLAEKYGDSFAAKFMSVFDDCGSFPMYVDEDDDVYSRLSLCNRETTEYIIDDLKAAGVLVTDLRTERSKALSADIMKLYRLGGDEVAEALTGKEKSGALTRKETISALKKLYGVCREAAIYYVNTYCEYKYRDE